MDKQYLKKRIALVQKIKELANSFPWWEEVPDFLKDEKYLDGFGNDELIAMIAQLEETLEVTQ